MKPLTLSRKRIEAAVGRGRGYAAQWRRTVKTENDWPWSCVELARIERVWLRMGRKQFLEDGFALTAVYGRPVLCSDTTHRLPGYVMPGWSSGAREGWEFGHGASNVWNGIRRNLYCSLVELLYGLVVGDATRRAQCESDLVTHWAVRVK